MSYIPPHKRHLKDPVRPSPVPDYLVTKFKKNLNFKNSRITYSGDYISKWFLIGSNGIEDEVPPYAKLVPMSSDSAECRNGAKSLVLMNNNVQKDVEMNNNSEWFLCLYSMNMVTKESDQEERTEWLLVAEKIEVDLVLAYERAKKGMESHHLLDNPKLILVARFGKILIHGHQAPVAEYSQKYSNKIFSTDVPTSFIQNIKSKAIPSHDFCIDMEKETYIVKVSHYTRPNVNIRCKCIMKEDGRLNICKTELNLVRHLVVDVSCIDKNLDMRLMLAGKRKITVLTEKEISNIQRLLDSATVDLNTKSRLRWPVSETSPANGYKILEVCHVRATTYINQTLRLRVRETDRFDEIFKTREINRGVSLILEELNTKLQEKNIERGCVMEMLRNDLGTIWDFLHCNENLTE